MAKKTPNGEYQCTYCNKKYADPVAADTCRDNHHLIYIPFTPEELNHLLLFIFNGDETLLGSGTVRKLQKYLRSSQFV